jgi:hypothetical protein
MDILYVVHEPAVILITSNPFFAHFAFCFYFHGKDRDLEMTEEALYGSWFVKLYTLLLQTFI